MVDNEAAIEEEKTFTEDELEKITLVFQEVYKKLLDTVPYILALNDQAAGRV